MIVNFLKSCDYENGYKDALQDALNWIERHSVSLKLNKLNKWKDIIKIMKAMLLNSEIMMKYRENAEMKLMPNGSLELSGEMDI